MAIQILVMTDDASAVQAVVSSLEERRARVMVHALDASLVVLAREVGPAAILLDATGDPSNADTIAHLLRHDGGFEGVPIFAIGGVLTDVTASYEDLSQARNAAAEILAVAELTHGFQDSGSEGLFDDVDNDDLSLESLMGPNHGSKVTRPPAPSGGRSAPPPVPPPRPPSRTGSIPAINVRTGAMPIIGSRDAPAAEPAAPMRASAGRETIALREELNAKDREIIELRDTLVSMERRLFETEDARTSVEEKVATLQSQLTVYEDEIEERQLNIDRLAQALDAEHVSASAAAAERDALRTQVAALEQSAAAGHEDADARAEEATSLAEIAIARAEEAEAAAQTATARAEAAEARAEEAAAALKSSTARAAEAEALAHAAEEERSAAVDELVAFRETAAESGESAKALEERLSGLTDDYDTVLGQRDEALSISQELDTALVTAEAQVADMHARVISADALVDALQADLAAYVDAAHRMAEQERVRLGLLGSLAATLQQASQQVAEVSAPAVGALPQTQWESAYNAYVADRQGPGSDDV